MKTKTKTPSPNWPKNGPPMWTLEQAITTLRLLEPKLRERGAHCALAGGVMAKGESWKDLDIIIYPEVQGKWDGLLLREFLKEFFIAAEIVECDDSSDSCEDDRDGKS